MYQNFLIFFLIIPIFCETNFTPKSFNLPPPPELINELAPKNITNGVKILENKVHGPESLVIENGAIYTCLKTGKCVKIINDEIEQTVSLTSNPDCGDVKKLNPKVCGHPLGLRRLNESTFLVADPFLGIIAVNFETNTTKVVFSPKTLVDGKPSKFIDDLDILDNDTLIFSDGSIKYGLDSLLEIFYENNKDGRIVKLKLSTGETEVLVNNISFANGVQVHPNKQSIIISESVTATIHRYYFDGPKKNQYEVFAENLPGFPDNVRLSTDKKSFYVALFSTRFKGKPSFFDVVGPHADVKKFLKEAGDNNHTSGIIGLFTFTDENYGIILQLDLDGKIISTYHDPGTKTIRTISTVVDDGEKYLYLGSYFNNYISRIPKN